MTDRKFTSSVPMMLALLFAVSCGGARDRQPEEGRPATIPAAETPPPETRPFDQEDFPEGEAMLVAQRRAAPGPAHLCPALVEGTTVEVEEADDAVALVFTTTGDVEELRRRVGMMAQMQGRMGPGRGMMGHGAGPLGRVPHTAEAEEIPGGARLVLRPTDPARLDELRGLAEQHAERLRAGECPMMQRMAHLCPALVEGTRVEVEEVDGAVAVDFTTTGDVEELRRRVEMMGQMHGRMGPGDGMMGPGMGRGRGGMMGPGMGRGHGMMDGGRGPMARIPHTAEVEEIPGGARLVLRPDDPARLDELRALAEMHAERMRAGECPMMEQRPPAPGDRMDDMTDEEPTAPSEFEFEE